MKFQEKHEISLFFASLSFCLQNGRFRFLFDIRERSRIYSKSLARMRRRLHFRQRGMGGQEKK